MVDFNNETTVATPPGEIVKVVVLERREQAIEALESYHMTERAGQDTQHKLDILHARIMAFWHQVQGMVKRRLAKAKGTEAEPSYDMVRKAISEAKTKEELMDAFEWLNDFIDDLGLTYIDGRAKYDRTNVEDANQKKGL